MPRAAIISPISPTPLATNYSRFHSGEVRCEHPLPPCQGYGVQRQTPTVRRWGVGLSNGVSHSMENRYIPEPFSNNP
jgi:hypothetical protein